LAATLSAKPKNKLLAVNRLTLTVAQPQQPPSLKPRWM
jgi:hypothetical protein